MKSKKALTMSKWLIGLILILAALGAILIFISALFPDLGARAETGIIEPIKSLAFGRGPSLESASAVVVYKEKGHGLRYGGWLGDEWTEWEGTPLEPKKDASKDNALAVADIDNDGEEELLLVYRTGSKFNYRIWDNDIWSSAASLDIGANDHEDVSDMAAVTADTNNDNSDEVFVVYCNDDYQLLYGHFKDYTWLTKGNIVKKAATCKPLELVAVDFYGTGNEVVMVIYKAWGIPSTGRGETPWKGIPLSYDLYENGKWQTSGFITSRDDNDLADATIAAGNFDDDDYEEVLIVYKTKDKNKIWSKILEYNDTTEKLQLVGKKTIAPLQGENKDVKKPLTMAAGDIDSDDNDEAVLVFGEEGEEEGKDLFYRIYNESGWNRPIHGDQNKDDPQFERIENENAGNAEMVTGDFDANAGDEEMMLVYWENHRTDKEGDLYGISYNYEKGWDARGECKKSVQCVEPGQATGGVSIAYKLVV